MENKREFEMEKKYRSFYIGIKVLFFAVAAALIVTGICLANSGIESNELAGLIMLFIGIVVAIAAIPIAVAYGVKSFSYNNFRICTVRGFFTVRLIIDDKEVDSATSPVGFSWILPLKGTLPTGEIVDAQIAPLWNGAFIHVGGTRI